MHRIKRALIRHRANVSGPVPAAQPVSNTIPTEVQANVLADTGTDVAGTLLLGLLLIGLGVATEVYGRRIGSAGGRG